MGAGAPLPAQITQEALFPDLSVWVVGECTGRQQCRLATRAMEKMCKDLAWAEDKLFDVKPPIEAELAQQVGDDEDAALQRLRLRTPPAGTGTSARIDFDLGHTEPEVLDMCERTEHGVALLRLVATAPALATTFGLQFTHGKQLVAIGHSIILRGPGLIEPQRTEDV